MADAGVDGVEILEGLMIFNNVRPLVALTGAPPHLGDFPRHRLCRGRGLMSYGPDFREIQRRTADTSREAPKRHPTRRHSGRAADQIRVRFAWVRLAQRIPVRIHIDSVPIDVVPVAGMMPLRRLIPHTEVHA
jgi:hypothetical protein